MERHHLRVGRHPLSDAFGRFASRASRATGSALAFTIAVVVVVVWALSGPLLGFSERWQLIINTVTTIVTFLMVFLIQHAQNKDSRALQLKLDELVAATEGASNRLIDIEDLTDDELEALYHRFQRLAKDAERIDRGARTSVEEEPEEAPALAHGVPGEQ